MGGLCQNLCTFHPNLRTIDRGGGGQKYTFLERSGLFTSSPKKLQIRAIGATREKLLQQKPKLLCDASATA